MVLVDLDSLQNLDSRHVRVFSIYLHLWDKYQYLIKKAQLSFSHRFYHYLCRGILLTLNTPIATKVVCFSRLLKCLRSLYGKQCGPRSDCSNRSGLFWVHAVCFYTQSSVMLGNYLQQTTSADDIFRCIFFIAL